MSAHSNRAIQDAVPEHVMIDEPCRTFRYKSLQRLETGLHVIAGIDPLAEPLDVALAPRADLEDQRRLAERVENRQMPQEFLSAWDTFISRFA